jgi:hypothetical protein
MQGVSKVAITEYNASDFNRLFVNSMATQSQSLVRSLHSSIHPTRGARYILFKNSTPQHKQQAH